jgi:hypothetical protein
MLQTVILRTKDIQVRGEMEVCLFEKKNRPSSLQNIELNFPTIAFET